VNQLPINTPSLRLRHFVPDEVALIKELNAEPSTSHWLPSHVYANEDEAQSTVGYLISCYSSPGDPRLGPYVLGVEHRHTGVLLGHVGFSPIGSDVEVSYAIAEASRGRGYGVEALVHSCKWAAEAFSLPSILALTAASNVASRRTLERSRFVHERDTLARFQGTEQVVSRYSWRQQ
jgi:RimJ/RimL family protein N-acetyltransferase